MSGATLSNTRAGAAGAKARPAGRVVCVLCPGGLEHSGGIGRCTSTLLSEIARRDPALRVELIDTRGPGHILFSPFHFARALLRITALALAGRCALIHANLSTHGSTLRKDIVSLLAAALRVPVVIHLHGSRFDRFYAGLPRFARGALDRMFRRAACVVVLGPYWQRVITGLMQVPAERVRVICNGVQAPAAPRPPRLAAPGGEAAPHLLFLGRLEPRKGTPELIEALGSPALRGLPWRATLAGDGNLAPYRAQAERLGLADRIAFPGWVGQAEVAALLAEADLLTLPSHAEGLPVAVLEGLAHRVPVVTTPVGSMPDFLADGDSVRFVPPGDVAALSGALARLLCAPEERARLAEGGWRAFQRHFEAGGVAEAFLSTYRDILARQGRRDLPARRTRRMSGA